MATHFSILAWEIPWIERPGRLQFMGSQRVRHNRETKHTEDLYPANSDTEKETEGDTDKWKDILCSMDWKNTVKTHMLPETTYIQCNLYQNPNTIFQRNRTYNPKICIKPEKTPNSQCSLEKEQSWRYHMP